MDDNVKAVEETVEAQKESVSLEAETKLAAAGLDKFKDVDALAKSYAELEKKFHDSRLPKNADLETLVAKTKGFYEGYESKSGLNGELGEWSTEFSKRTGIPAQVIDYVTAKVASRTVKNQAEARKSEVRSLLEDKEILARINKALEEKGADYEADLSGRIKAGHVTAGELKALAELGMEKVEPGSPIEAETSPSGGSNSEEELMSILNNRSHPYYNPSHADYHKAQDRVEKLKKVLGF